jgi:hypothetical protein
MSRVEYRVRSILIAVGMTCLFASAACSDKTPKTSSESNWLKCKNDADCARLPGALCSLAEQVCVTPEGEPTVAPADASAPASNETDSGVIDSDDGDDAAVPSDGDGATPTSSSSPAGSTAVDAAASDSTLPSDAASMPSDPALPLTDGATPGQGLDNGGADAATAAALCSELATDTWLSLDGPDVAWPPAGQLNYSPDAIPDLVTLVVGDTLFVLDRGSARLFALEVCTSTWTELTVPVAFPVSTGTRPQNERFVTWQGETEYPTLDPKTGGVELRPVSEFQGSPSSIDWPNSGSEGARQASSGVAWPYTLYVGGALRTTDEERAGGAPDVLIFGDAQLYDARTAELRPVNDSGAPSPRLQAKVLPMGKRFLVWGGYAEADDSLPLADSALSDGAIYDPATDSWSPVTASNAPEQPAASSLFYAETAMPSFWTGSHLLVIGADSPRIYDPDANTWRSVTGGEALRGDGAAIGPGHYVEMFAGESLVLDLGTATVESRAVGLTPTPLSDEVATLQQGIVAWSVDAWVGATRVRWGAAAHWGEGCDNPPPGVGCDPVPVSQTIEGGAFVQFSE